jgi:glycosyltransferase involved in cell wall biosynthesis
MSYGLPCVVSDCGGLPESVVHGVTGYTEPADDAETMAHRVCFLLENPDIAFKLGENGRKNVTAYFMPDQWGGNIMNMLENCLRGKGV